MKKRKLMMTVMSLALVLVVAVGGTLAYLSDQSNQVVNTFNVGEGYIPEDPDDPESHKGLWLDETAKPEVGNPLDPDPNNRTETGVAYEEMMPGSVVAKDPTFHLTNNSTTSYVFAFVDGVDAMIEDGYIFAVNKPEALTDPVESVFASQWKKLPEGTEGFDGWYVYVVNNAAEEEAVKYGVVSTKTEIVEGESITTPGTEMASMFNYVKLGSSVDNEQFAVIGPGEVVIGGVAVQTANLTMKEAFAEAQRVWDEAHNTTGTDEPVEP